MFDFAIASALANVAAQGAALYGYPPGYTPPPPPEMKQAKARVIEPLALPEPDKEEGGDE